VEDIQVLPLVLVEALGWNVEERFRVHLQAHPLLNKRGQAPLRPQLDLAPLLHQSR